MKVKLGIEKHLNILLDLVWSQFSVFLFLYSQSLSGCSLFTWKCPKNLAHFPLWISPLVPHNWGKNSKISWQFHLKICMLRKANRSQFNLEFLPRIADITHGNINNRQSLWFGIFHTNHWCFPFRAFMLQFQDFKI